MLAPAEPAVTITPKSLPAEVLFSSLSAITASQVQKQAFSFVELCATQLSDLLESLELFSVQENCSCCDCSYQCATLIYFMQSSTYFYTLLSAAWIITWGTNASYSFS